MRIFLPVSCNLRAIPAPSLRRHGKTCIFLQALNLRLQKTIPNPCHSLFKNPIDVAAVVLQNDIRPHQVYICLKRYWLLTTHSRQLQRGWALGNLL